MFLFVLEEKKWLFSANPQPLPKSIVTKSQCSWRHCRPVWATFAKPDFLFLGISSRFPLRCRSSHVQVEVSLFLRKYSMFFRGNILPAEQPFTITPHQTLTRLQCGPGRFILVSFSKQLQLQEPHFVPTRHSAITVRNVSEFSLSCRIKAAFCDNLRHLKVL